MTADADKREKTARAAVRAMEKAAAALAAYARACAAAGETIHEHGDTRKTLQADLREFAGWLDDRYPQR